MVNPHDFRIKLNEEDVKIFKEYDCKSILEIFFGDGRNIIQFKKLGFNVEGIDDGLQQHNDYVLKGRENANKAKTKTKVENIFDKKLPYEENSFEGVYAWHYINHNYKEKIIELFKEVYRIIKPDGIFSLRFTKMEDLKYKMINENLAETILSEEELKQGFEPEKIKVLGSQTFSRFVAKESGIPHYAYYRDELINDLNKIGFKVIKIKSVLWNWHVWCQK